MSHVSLVTLGVRDLPRAEAFYLAMGWHRSSASVEGTVTFLRGGALVLALFVRDDFAADAALADDALAEPPGPIALACNLETEEAVDDAFRRAEAAGARIVKAPTRADWGGYSGYLADPEGHLWEFAHNPGFGLRDDGAVVLPDES
ncbi:VOC family protein [Egicoccus sp. AB-alg2]|uniref:VOC family protein n=1 Tax=Egicoccus sp. AB-alg2 TaxID=3242693 RepID=UPI00359DFE13